MFKLLREISGTESFGFHPAFDDDINSSFSGFSESKNGVKIPRRATIRDVQPGDQWSCKTQVLSVVVADNHNVQSYGYAHPRFSLTLTLAVTVTFAC